MKYLRKIFESEELIDYDKFFTTQSYRYDISRTIIKKVEDEMRDEILEFFYSLIDDLTPAKDNIDSIHDLFISVRDTKKSKGANSWSYRINDSFQDYRGHSSTNTISKTSRDFIAVVNISLTDFDSNTIMSEVKSIYGNLVDSNYKCEYSYNHKVSEGNVPRNGYKGEQTQSLNLSFDIHIKGDVVLPKIGVDINKLKGR